MAPERLMLPDEQAVEILKLVDGKANVGGIVEALAATSSTRRVRRSRATSTDAAGSRRTKGVWAMSTKKSPAVDPPLGAARGADASLSAALPLLLQSARARARVERARRRGAGGACSARRPRSACCRSISPAASRRCGATSTADRRHAARRALHQSDHRGRAAATSARSRRWPRPASTMCSSASRTHDAANADRIAGLPGRPAQKKLAGRRPVRAAGLPLTINAVVHRQNIDGSPRSSTWRWTLGARRLEIAHVQYSGWALAQPRRADAEPRAGRAQATRIVEAARERLKGVLASTTSCPTTTPCCRSPAWAAGARQLPERHAVRARSLPCHAAADHPGLDFASVRDASLAEIWHRSAGLQALPRHGLDAGALPRAATGARSTGAAAAARRWRSTGDAARTDPACALSPDHGLVEAALGEANGSRRTSFTAVSANVRLIQFETRCHPERSEGSILIRIDPSLRSG